MRRLVGVLVASALGTLATGSPARAQLEPFIGEIRFVGFTTATVSSAAEGYVFNVDDVRTAVTPP